MRARRACQNALLGGLEQAGAARNQDAAGRCVWAKAPASRAVVYTSVSGNKFLQKTAEQFAEEKPS